MNFSNIVSIKRIKDFSIEATEKKILTPFYPVFFILLMLKSLVKYF